MKPVQRGLQRRFSKGLREGGRRLRDAIRPKAALLGVVADVTRTRSQLLAENAALRQQLIVLSRGVRKPQLRPVDRVVLAATAAFTSTWRETILLVKPETVLRWHRQGFRLFWRRKSRRTTTPRRLSADVISLIFAFFIVDVNKKTVVHVGVTRSPSEAWTAQQLREVTPFGEGGEVIIRDRDSKFGGEFDRVATGAGMRVVRTAVRAPNMNAVCERFIGSTRRECLDHVLILGERHMETVSKEYAFEYFNRSRPHQGIGQRIPMESEREPYAAGTDVVAFPILGGLHHDYRVAA